MYQLVEYILITRLLKSVGEKATQLTFEPLINKIMLLTRLLTGKCIIIPCGLHERFLACMDVS